MAKIRLTLSNLLFWLIIIVSCYFIENIGLLTEQSFRGFDPTSFWLIFGLLMVLIVTYFFLEHKYNGLKADFILLPIILVMFGIMTWTIWTQPSATSNTLTIYNVGTGFVSRVTFTNFEKLEYTAELGVSLIVLYMLLFVYSRQKVRSRKTIWFPMIYILITLLSCVGTLITDLDNYKAFFSGASEYNGVSFWYYNENLFGFVLLLGILCCFVVNVQKQRWWSYICMFVFLAELIFTSCATAIFIAVVAIPSYILFEIICGFKKHPFRSMFLLMLYFTVIFGGIALYTYLDKIGVGFANKISSFLTNNLSEKDFSTLSRRTIVWQEAIDFVSDTKIHLWFGRGYRTSVEMFRGYTAALGSGSYVSSAHSAYIEILLRNGLLGLILYGLALLYYLIATIHLIVKKNFRFAMIHLLCVACLAVQGVMESDTFFTSNVTGIAETAFFIMPVLRAHKHIIHPKLTKSIKQMEIKKEKIDYHKLSHTISSVINALIIACGSVMLSNPIYDNKTAVTYVGFIVLILVTLNLFYPYLISIFYRHAKKKRFIFRVIYSSIFVYGLPLGLLCLKLFVPTFNDISLTLVPITMAIILFIFYMLYVPLCGGSFKEWIKDTFIGWFVTPIFGIIFSVLLGYLGIVIVNELLPINYQSMLILAFITIVLYFYGFLFIPRKETKDIIEHFNNNGLIRLNYLVNKDKI